MTNLSIWMANQTYHWTTVLKNILFGPCSSPNLASEKQLLNEFRVAFMVELPCNPIIYLSKLTKLSFIH